jgi:hypothetical protein
VIFPASSKVITSMMSMLIVVPPMLGRACIGKAHSPAATRTGPVRRSSIESAIVLICVKNSPMASWPSWRGVPTGSSTHASGVKSATYASLSPAVNAPV